MVKNFTVLELINSVKEFNDIDSRNKYIVSNVKIVNEYLEFNNKSAICDLLIDTTCRNKNGDVYFDFSAMKLLYILNLINIYSNIEIVFGDSDYSLVEQYDDLCRYGVIKYFLGVFDKYTDKEEFDSMLQDKIKSFEKNNCSNLAIIKSQVDRIVGVGRNLLEPLIESLEKNMPEILKSATDNLLENMN